MKPLTTLALVLSAGSMILCAQAPAPVHRGGDMRHDDGQPPPPRPARSGMMQPGPGGRWWNNPETAQRFSLNSDQQKKMDDIFQANRLRLIDLNATLHKEEITMEPLMSFDPPDEAKILAQIDKVAQARAELEKANARFLLGIRRVLTPDQWKKLQAERPNASPVGTGGRRGPGGPAPADGRR